MNAKLTEKPQMRLYAHRGTSTSRPENTVDAIKKAFYYPEISGCEVDIRITKDKKLIILHDKTLARTGNLPQDLANTPVSKLNLQQIKKYEVGSWKSAQFRHLRVPRFKKILKLLPSDKQYILDLKDVTMEMVQLMKYALSEYCFKQDQIICLVTNHKFIPYIKNNLPQVKVLYLQFLSDSTKLSYQLASLIKVKSLGADGVSWPANPTLINQALVDYLHGLQLEIGVWVYKSESDTPENWNYMNGIGVDHFTSNIPSGCLNYWDR